MQPHQKKYCMVSKDEKKNEMKLVYSVMSDPNYQIELYFTEINLQCTDTK